MERVNDFISILQFYFLIATKLGRTEKDTKDIPKDCADVDSLDSVNREQNSKQRR